MSNLFQLIRIRQWIKNAFIVLPAFFGGALSLVNLTDLLIGFFAFSFTASSIYVFNDINDIEADRLHPTKKLRPIPSNLISKQNAILVAVILILVAVVGSSLLLPNSFLYVLLSYFLLNLAYSSFLKNVSIIDLLIVSMSFVLRLLAGSELVDVELSFWLLLMTFLFSLFIVIAKRRDDFTSENILAEQLRKVNKHYNLPFLNIVLATVSSLLMVCYIMYTTTSIYFLNRPFFALSSCILVVVGLIRYFQAVYVEDKGGSPTDFALNDRATQGVLILWLSIFCYLIYF